MPAVIEEDKCIGCEICVPACPGDLIFMDEATGVAVVRYPDECWYCNACIAECPVDCIIYEFPVAAHGELDPLRR